MIKDGTEIVRLPRIQLIFAFCNIFNHLPGNISDLCPLGIGKSGRIALHCQLQIRNIARLKFFYRVSAQLKPGLSLSLIHRTNVIFIFFGHNTPRLIFYLLILTY